MIILNFYDPDLFPNLLIKAPDFCLNITATLAFSAKSIISTITAREIFGKFWNLV